MAARLHPTAEIEDGVVIGSGTAVWGHAHLRSGARVGAECIVGEKTYLGPDVVVGDRVKLNAMVYVPTGVTIHDGVMVGAGTVFTNDRYPRATDPALSALRDSGPGEHTLETVVEQGAGIGAGCTIGCGLTIGRWAMVGMGAVVTRSVPPFHLVVGSPARSVGFVCRCGEPLLRFPTGTRPADGERGCGSCGLRYCWVGGVVRELDPPGCPGAADA